MSKLRFNYFKILKKIEEKKLEEVSKDVNEKIINNVNSIVKCDNKYYEPFCMIFDLLGLFPNKKDDNKSNLFANDLFNFDYKLFEKTLKKINPLTTRYQEDVAFKRSGSYIIIKVLYNQLLSDLNNLKKLYPTLEITLPTEEELNENVLFKD